MEATIHITGKKAVKILGAAALATGVVALSAVVASGAAVGAVAEGFRTAKNTMQRILKKEENVTAEEPRAESPDEVMEVRKADEVDRAEAAEETDKAAVTEEIDRAVAAKEQQAENADEVGTN